jgi:hypothetical protein
VSGSTRPEQVSVSEVAGQFNLLLHAYAGYISND